MSSYRRPYIYCHTCHSMMPAPEGPVSDVIVQTPEEAMQACTENATFSKLLMCHNPLCFAPQRAIIMPRNMESVLVAKIRSWSPIITFRLRYQDNIDQPDNTLAVAEFAVDKIRRIPDISLSASVDIDLLRRTIDGFGREIRGSFTVFDLYCWGDVSHCNNWLLHPIEAFDPSKNLIPPRFSPFCQWIRQRVYKLVVDELRRRGKGSCPFRVSDPQAPQSAYRHRPVCTQCDDTSKAGSIPPHNCYYFSQLLSQFSPCYECDKSTFAAFMNVARRKGVNNGAKLWKTESRMHMFHCWAGFAEMMCPIIIHDHLVAGVMTGQLIELPEDATKADAEELLSLLGANAVSAARARLQLDDSDVSLMSRFFDLQHWQDSEHRQQCLWLVRPTDVEAKATCLITAAEKIEHVCQERYKEDRRLREERFQEELLGRFEMARQEANQYSSDFLPGLLSRMSETWGFKEVAFLSASPRTKGMLAVLADSHRAMREDDRTKCVPPIRFSPKAPPLGALLAADDATHFVEKPGCDWRSSVQQAQEILGWRDIRGLVAYVIPTTLGQDLFIFNRRDRSVMSYKPQEKGPSTLCLESIRRVCSALSNRIADWAYFRQQALFQHVFGHTVKTPIELTKTALKNLIHDYNIPHTGSVNSLKMAIHDVTERVELALEVANAFRDFTEPERQVVDLLDEIRKVCRQYSHRYGNDWQLSAADAATWPICISKKRLDLLLSNGLANAFKYSYKNRDIRVIVKDSRSYGTSAEPVSHVCIQNLGDGVSPYELPLLGTMLYRGDAAINKPGSGLGLFLIDWIMKREWPNEQDDWSWKFDSCPSGGFVNPDTTQSYNNQLVLKLPRRIER